MRVAGLATLVAIGLFALVLAGPVVAQVSQVPDLVVPEENASALSLVTECDSLAAHPNDPQRMTEGVADDRIVPRLAIMACELALKESPDDARFQFQLGRALLASGKKELSTEAFKKAAKAGHAAAWAYVGDAHRAKDEYQEAFDSYGAALKGGFERAKSPQDMMLFDKTNYALSTIADIYDGALSQVSDRARTNSAETRSYVYAMIQKFMGECDEVVSPSAIVALFNFRYNAGTTSEAESAPAVGANIAAGEYDGQAFLRRHGCESPVSRQLFGNIEQLVKAR